MALILALAICGALLIYSCIQIEREKQSRVLAEIDRDGATSERDSAIRWAVDEVEQRMAAETRAAEWLRLANQRGAQVRIMEEAWPQPHQILPTLVRPALAVES